jgi:hypothetical protein
VEAMVSAYGLQSLPGSDGQVKVHEDVAEMSKGFKTGTSIPFTATLNAAYDETKIRQPSPSATSSVELLESSSAVTEVVATMDDTADIAAVTAEVIDAVVADATEANDSEDATREIAWTADD